MAIKYEKLDKNSICVDCSGCSRLEIPSFSGVFDKKDCTEEIVPQYYGSEYGNNN